MKTKNYIISLLLIVFFSFALQVQAAETHFKAGALVIPMDSFYQSDDDGGILEAFGLAFYLLNHKDTNGDNDITLYWMINQKKKQINDPDVVVEVTALPSGVDTVVEHYDRVNGLTDLTFNTNTGDSELQVTYSGAPFIVAAKDVSKAMAIIGELDGDGNGIWDAVDIHQIEVPFSAMVYQQMRGTPPILP